MVEIDYVKKELLSNPIKIKELLEFYSYCSISIHGDRYMNFARDCEGNAKSIVINLRNNDALFVHDYPLNITKDIFSYIITMRHVTFRDVIMKAKNILGINSYGYSISSVYKPFGGLYDKIKRTSNVKLQTIDESELDEYEFICNKRFLRDRISLRTQRFFGIRFDVVNQAIVIPIRNELGELVGIKARLNEDEPLGNKYFYLHPTMISQTLYGFSQNYEYLVNNEVYVFEAEKSVMQCHSYGIRNCVSIGSSTLSKKQAQLLLSVCPSRIILAHDKSIGFEVIKRNISMILKLGRMREFEVCYIDMESDISIPEKSSPSDLGRDRFIDISNNNLICYTESEEVDAKN